MILRCTIANPIFLHVVMLSLFNQENTSFYVSGIWRCIMKKNKPDPLSSAYRWWCNRWSGQWYSLQCCDTWMYQWGRGQTQRHCTQGSQIPALHLKNMWIKHANYKWAQMRSNIHLKKKKLKKKERKRRRKKPQPTGFIDQTNRST